MYLHSKYGFVEADRWDGSRLPRADHQSLLDQLAGPVIVVRSRHQATLSDLAALLPTTRTIPVLESPQGWDYEWRMYLTATEWGAVMAAIAMDLDYRNFKSWHHDHRPEHYKLAYAIWDAACRDRAASTYGSEDDKS